MNEIFQNKYWERDKLKTRRSPQHPVVSAFVLSKIKEIQKYIKIDENTKLLDVGTGNGFYSFQFEKLCDVFAIDYSDQMISANPAKNKKVMDANNLEFPDNEFDVVFESCLLHHVEDIDKVIAEMKRVAKKYVVIAEPNRNNPLQFLFSLKKEERKSLKFSLSYLRKILEKHNLNIISSFTHGVIAPNKIPSFLLPLIKIFDKKIPILGLDNIVICEKTILPSS
ncbi:class I SAM-dependent methyltransferase [Patescibacteria group bacterium]|nr:class I SAM-dependent methyltransferase [Patescibacteria group bacterium]